MATLKELVDWLDRKTELEKKYKVKVKYKPKKDEDEYHIDFRRAAEDRAEEKRRDRTLQRD